MIRELARQLPGETASLDAQVLLAHIMGHNRAWVLSHPEARLNATQEKNLETALNKLQAGMPLPYVLGHWEFFGLDFLVSPAVLIPRPETELLIETALAQTRAHPQATFRFLDIGTGSGIIPITLAIHVPQSEIVATDISSAALAVARLNAVRHGVSERITFIEADLLPDDLQPASFNIITANLPYIPTESLQELQIYGREPELALDGGIDGLDLIRQLLARLAEKTTQGCIILLEIEHRQGMAVVSLANTAFPSADVSIRKDLAGLDRLIIINT